jgi:DNA-binding transcriptional LysR family regulator
MRLDLFSLQLVQHIMSTGSLTEAAKLSHISLQAASERLKKLEQHFQTTLFIRQNHGLKPTLAAETLLRHSQALFEHAEQLQQAMQIFAQQPMQHLKLCCNSSAQSEYLPALLPQFLQKYPHFQIELYEAESRDIVTKIQNGQAELGIISNFFNPKNLAVEAFAIDPLVLICASEHRLSGYTQVELAKALNYPFIGLMHYQSLQKSIEAQAKLLNIQIQYRLRLPNFAAIAQVVSENIGVAIIPRRAAQHLQSNYAFHCVELSGAWANRELLVVAKDFVSLSPSYQLLSKFLLNQAKQL